MYDNQEKKVGVNKEKKEKKKWKLKEEMEDWQDWKGHKVKINKLFFSIIVNE